MSEQRILGFRPILSPAEGQIVTQAFILCANCQAVISSNMGPQYGSLCVKCAGDLLDEMRKP